MSLRRRVVWSCVAVAVVLLLADVVVARTVRTYLLEGVDTQLVQTANRFADFAGRGPGFGPGFGPQPQAFSEYFIGFTDVDGRLVARLDTAVGSRAAPELSPGVVSGAAVAPGEQVQPFTARDGAGGDWRFVAVRPAGQQIVVLGTPLDSVAATHGRIVAVLAVATVAVLGTLGSVAAWIVRQGVRPLSAMTRTARSIADGDLSERVDAVDPATEAGELGDALNTMLGRIEGAFDRQAESEARLRRFVADASHELRTPLTSIRGYAELHRAGGLADEEALAPAMRRIESEAARMGLLVDDLLALARLDAERPLERRLVRVDELVRDAVTDARAAEPHRTITTDLHAAPAEADLERLHQAVANLISNARTHTPDDAVIHVTVGCTAAAVRITVADDGPGMAPEDAERAFERFHRADAARRRSTGGTGLGLAIVASVAAAHGGRAGLSSSPGNGTTVIIEIPAAPQDAGSQEAPSGLRGDDEVQWAG